MKRKARAVGKRILGFFIMIGGILLMAGGVIMFVGSIGIYFFTPTAEQPAAPMYLVWVIAAIAIMGGLLVFAFGICLLFNFSLVV